MFHDMFDIRAAVAAAILAAAAANVSARPTETSYNGICEASAAVALDGKRFIVADDEHNVLSIYKFGVAGRKGTVDLTTYLDTTNADGKVKKSDLEAAARVDGRIFWIASHSRDKKGNREETRLRFFATPLIVRGGRTEVAVPTTPPYRGLLDDLTADPRMRAIAAAAAAKSGPEDADGLNIEGLAATPEGHLLIGFRNPRPQGMALLVPFENPDEVLAGKARARFGDPIPLDLGKRGIRSIDWVENRYLIVAGPYDNGAGGGEGSDFALYGWSGQRGERPRRWVNAQLGTLGPEALFQIPGSQLVHLLSDDGDLCKKAMSFRATTLDLSTAVFE